MNLSKQSFMRKNKIERLLSEQKIILDNIPDGAMIFKKKEDEVVALNAVVDLPSEYEPICHVRYLNAAFFQMFD